MFDSRLRPIIDPPLKRAASFLAQRHIDANSLTWLGFAVGIAAAFLVAFEHYLLALFAILLNRLADGLDGALARARDTVSDYGAYLDIVLDMIFYGAVIFAFAAVHPGDNGFPAAFLLAGFMATCSSFLGFAAIAATRGMTEEMQGHKSIYYLAGLAEGAETIGFFALMCLFPGAFSLFALIFGLLCFATAAGRLSQARDLLKPPAAAGQDAD